MTKEADPGEYRAIALLNKIPGIPGNGVIIPGQKLLEGFYLHMATISPEPQEGKQRTIDFLVDTYIVPKATSKQIEKVKELVTLYEGLEPDTIFLLGYSLLEGNFNTTVLKFNDFYKNNLSKNGRPAWLRPTCKKTLQFYLEMGWFVNAVKHREMF